MRSSLLASLAKNPHEGEMPEGFTFVELEGIEPSSKQGNPVLSTRLSQPLVFECRQDLGHQPTPYPLKFHRQREAAGDYPPICCTTMPERLGACGL